MLRGTVAFVFLIAFAVVGSEIRRALQQRGVRAPAMEGMSFLAVGFLLGEQGFGLLADDVMAGLRVVVLFGLAWIGFAVGVQMEFRIIRRLPSWQRWIGPTTAGVIGVAVALGGVLGAFDPALGLGLAAVAMAVSSTSLEAMVRSRGLRDRGAVRLLKVVAAYSGLPTIAVFAVAGTLASPLIAGHWPFASWNLLVALIGVGVVGGYVLVILARGVREPMQLLTLTAGTMCAVAGVSAMLGLSAVPAAAFAGAIVVNRSVFPHRMLRVAHSIERPIVVALLFLVGASWEAAAFSWPVFLLMSCGRVTGALAGGALLTRLARSNKVDVRVPAFGLGLLPQGELALGLVVAIVSFFPGTEGVLEAVAASIIVGNAASHLWMRRWLFGDAPKGGA